MTRFAFNLIYDTGTFAGISGCIAWIGSRDFWYGVVLLVTVVLLIVCRQAADVRRTEDRRKPLIGDHE